MYNIENKQDSNKLSDTSIDRCCEEYEAVFEVKELIVEKNRAIISTTIFNSEGKSVLSGEATIMNTEAIHSK